MNILEILKLVQEEFIDKKYCCDGYPGLCSVASKLMIYKKISYEDRAKFNSYLRRSKRGQIWFYTCVSHKVLDRDQFVWPIFEITGRLDWLELHIIKKSK